jgi:hypothetical protein
VVQRRERGWTVTLMRLGREARRLVISHARLVITHERGEQKNKRPVLPGIVPVCTLCVSVNFLGASVVSILAQ